MIGEKCVDTDEIDTIFVATIVNEKPKLIEIEFKEEIIKIKPVVEDNVDNDIKAGSEQLQVQELSHVVEVTPIGISGDIVIPVIMESQ